MTQPDLARLEGLSTRLREMVSADGRSICCNKRTTAQMGSDILEAAVSLPALLARVRELEKAGQLLLWQYDRKGPLAESEEAWEQLRAALALNKEPADVA